MLLCVSVLCVWQKHYMIRAAFQTYKPFGTSDLDIALCNM